MNGSTSIHSFALNTIISGHRQEKEKKESKKERPLSLHSAFPNFNSRLDSAGKCLPFSSTLCASVGVLTSYRMVFHLNGRICGGGWFFVQRRMNENE